MDGQISSVLLSIAVALLLLAFIELGSYFSLKIAGTSPETAQGSIQYYDGLCGWRYYSPEGFRWVDYSDHFNHSTVILLDKWGFNTTAKNLALHKSPGEIRIAVTGASAIFGIGCQKPAWNVPSQLQAELRRIYPSVKIQVINACVRGYSSFQQFTFYLSYLRSFQPDVVIAVVGTNDLNLPPVQGRLGASQPIKNDYMLGIEKMVNQMERNETPPKLGKFIAYYLARTSTGRLINLLAQRYGAGDWVTTTLTAQKRRVSPAKNHRARNLRELAITARTCLNTLRDYRAAVENQGGRFLGVLRPVAALSKPLTKKEQVFVQDSKGHPSLQTQRRRIFYGILGPQMSKERGLYDLSGVFTNKPNETLYVDASHYRPQAAKIIASVLADLLQDQAWFRELIAKVGQPKDH